MIHIEVLFSAALSWGIGGSGARGVGANETSTFQPALYFGKSFGDLPDHLAWLRPFAVTGEFALEIPTVSRSTILGVNSAGSALVDNLTKISQLCTMASQSNIAPTT